MSCLCVCMSIQFILQVLVETEPRLSLLLGLCGLPVYKLRAYTIHRFIFFFPDMLMPPTSRCGKKRSRPADSRPSGKRAVSVATCSCRHQANRLVRGETQTSADSFCRAVGHKFQNEITIQSPRLPAWMLRALEQRRRGLWRSQSAELTFLRGGASPTGLLISALRNIWRFITRKEERSSDSRRARPRPSWLRVHGHRRYHDLLMHRRKRWTCRLESFSNLRAVNQGRRIALKAASFNRITFAY